MSKQYFLFDLDGTLTNPKLGITSCVQYALESFGIQEPDADQLECYIGPPLYESFMKFHGLNSDQAAAAVEKYRERYTDIGIFENEAIEGIENCLKALKQGGATIALATCKPEIFAVRILEKYGLAQYFDVTAGSTIDGSIKYKNQVIEEVFRRITKKQGNSIDMNDLRAEALMIGDRVDDIAGAQKCMIESVGVRFGYAKEGELEDAGADYIVETVDELKELLLELREN